MADGWESFEDARRRQMTAGLCVPPATRLRWLEEMLRLAHRSGTLAKRRERPPAWMLRPPHHRSFGCFKSALIGLLCLPPAIGAASQCPPSDVCEVTTRVLSVREGPADELGISRLDVRMRILSVGRMVEKSRFSPPALTCADAYRKGQKVDISRLKGAGKGLKDSGNEPRALEGFRPGAVLRGEIRYGCDERTSWHDFENAVALRPAGPASPAQSAGDGAKPRRRAEPKGPRP